jgi:hypothetical protein
MCSLSFSKHRVLVMLEPVRFARPFGYQSTKMRCPSCMAENAPTRRFCAQCGARLPLSCSARGFENKLSAKFCGGCGKLHLGLIAGTLEHSQVSISGITLAGYPANGSLRLYRHVETRAHGAASAVLGCGFRGEEFDWLSAPLSASAARSPVVVRNASTAAPSAPGLG